MFWKGNLRYFILKMVNNLILMFTYGRDTKYMWNKKRGLEWCICKDHACQKACNIVSVEALLLYM